MSNSFETLWAAALKSPLSLDFPGKNTGVGWEYISRNMEMPIQWDNAQTNI